MKLAKRRHRSICRWREPQESRIAVGKPAQHRISLRELEEHLLATSALFREGYDNAEVAAAQGKLLARLRRIYRLHRAWIEATN